MKEKKKLLSLLLVIAMIISLAVPVMAAGDTNEKSDASKNSPHVFLEYTSPFSDEIDDSAEQAEESDSAGHESAKLEASDTVYTNISAAATYLQSQLKQRVETITVQYRTSSTASATTINNNGVSIYNTALSVTENGDEGDYIFGHIRSLSATTSTSSSLLYKTTTYTFTVSYMSNRTMEDAVDTAAENLLNSFNFNSNTSDYTKVSTIYNYMTRNIVYGNPEELVTHSAYAAIIDHNAVCQGYALLFYRLAVDSGLNARIVFGLGNGGNHAWNIVEVDGKYYNLDSTWDAELIQAGRSYSFFLVGSDNFPYHTAGQFTEGTVPVPDENASVSKTDYEVPTSQLKITAQPEDASANAGETAVFTVDATGTDLSYQWQEYNVSTGNWTNSEETGNTTDTLSVPVKNQKNGWKYRCVITDSNGSSLASEEAVLTVTGNQYIAYYVSLSGTHVYYPVYDEDYYISEGETYEIEAVAERVKATLSWQWYDDNTGKWTTAEEEWNNEYQDVMGDSVSYITILADKTIDNKKIRAVSTDEYGVITYGDAFTFRVVGEEDAPVIVSQPGSCLRDAGDIVDFEIIAAGVGLTYQWYYKKANASVWTVFEGKTESVLEFYTEESQDGMKVRCKVTAANGKSVTSDGNAQLDISAGFGYIKQHPEDQTVAEGETALFTVETDGAKTYSYVWQYWDENTETWESVEDLTASYSNEKSTLEVPATRERNGCRYRCIVMDDNWFKDWSHPATLTVISGISITAQPADVSVEVGKTATFTVAATGTGLSYQWQYQSATGSEWKNSSMTGSDTATISVPASAKRNGQKYRCIVSDGSGNSVISEAAQLTVTGGVTITTQPKSVSAKAGSTAKFSVTATGSGLSYQWQYRASSSGTWKNSGMTGNTTATISVPAAEKRNGQQYRCVVTDKNGNKATSKAATLTVLSSGLAITSQPVSVTAGAGETATFTVKATGSGLSYQWQYRVGSSGTWKNSGMTGSTTATIRVPAIDRRNGQQYRCVVMDENGNKVTSKAATLTVESTELEIITQPTSQSGSEGDTAIFRVVAQGSGLTYQWQYKSATSTTWKNSGMTGSKTSKLYVPVKASRNGQKYRCIITDANGDTLITNAATLTVK